LKNDGLVKSPAVKAVREPPPLFISRAPTIETIVWATFYEIIKNALNKILILINKEPEAKKSQKPLTGCGKTPIHRHSRER
jgi:hypothetical protein